MSPATAFPDCSAPDILQSSSAKELCGSRNILALHHLADNLVFLLRDVELVQPANNLDFLPVFFIDPVDQLTNERVRVQQVVRQQQLSLIVDALEQKRHGRV